MAPKAAQQRRTQAERRSESEEALLNAAAALIAERGVERASLASIGESAGASRGLPTHHFGSKDGLVARLAGRVQDHFVAAVVDALEQRAHRKPEEVSALDLLRTTLDTYFELFEHPTADERALIVMWGATFPASASIDGMLEADRRSYDGWADLIRHGQEDGSIRQDVDATAAAVALFGLMRGVAALLLTESDITDMGNVRTTCDAWIVAALAAPAAREGGADGDGR
ncbi:MAG TPA: TetR/AcrR family transcriptional regulator [Acidimicrobiia bacterium]|nr:TetR/AcrR family transcriptional regulator [Acidimicrobiia bacterium]